MAGRGWEVLSRGRGGRFSGGFALLALLAVLGPGASAASAAPTSSAAWASSVFSNTARLSAQIDPNGGGSTTYHFDYTTKAAYDADRGRAGDGFTGAQRVPAVSEANLGFSPGTVTLPLSSLAPDTFYYYRLIARNSGGTYTGPPQFFVTQGFGTSSVLADGRGWEMVSPIDKNGGQIDPAGAIAGGGVLQAAAQGGSITYGSSASFGAGAQGAPPSSQYIASRTGSGWSTLNITPPLFSGSFGVDPLGVPYQLFTGDLARGLMLNGRPCRGEATGCPVANPPLAGTDAPAGYQNYYLRETATASFEALLGAADIGGLGLDPAEFALSFAGASPDLRNIVLSTCAALTAGATDGCGTSRANLYLWSSGALRLVNTTPGAALAAQSGAVSTNSGRVYWRDLSTGNLHLRAGAGVRQVDLDAGGGGTFETATPDGATALYTQGGDLWSYNAGTDRSSRLASGVSGVLGLSDNASYIYYVTASGVFLIHGGPPVRVAEAADASNYPPTTGTSRVSADGTKLAFVSTPPLTRFDGTRYDNTNLNTRALDSQVYLYDATGAGTLTCASCNPTNARPVGASTIPGATRNGQAADSTHSYKPRVLSSDGKRVYFESLDADALADTNSDWDVYQWEAQGSGSCARAGGCVSLISSGKASDGASFVDASADGTDVFFLTGETLVTFDPGSIDLYDARVGGGFPDPIKPIACEGDACQSLPPDPGDPTLTTLLSGPGNPPVRYHKLNKARKAKRCPKGTKKQGRKCIKKRSKRRNTR